MHVSPKPRLICPAQVLIAAGADVNSVDIHGQTPLSLACANANTGMAFALLIAGADLDTMASLEAQWVSSFCDLFLCI